MSARSGGPRTSKGKASSSMNAIRHGLSSTSPVIRGVEDPREWARFRSAIVADLAPVGAVEEHLAERVALGFWRQLRCARAETAAGNALVEEARAALAANLPGYEEEAAAAHSALAARRLARIEAGLTAVERIDPAVERFNEAHARLERVLGAVSPMLAMGDLGATELRVRYETAASKFAREALADLRELQSVRFAKAKGAA